MNTKALTLLSSLLFLVACQKSVPIVLKEAPNTHSSSVSDDLAYGQNLKIFPGLPVQWYTQEDINASPKSRPLPPPKCIPLYFSPNDVIKKSVASGEYYYVQKANKMYLMNVIDSDVSTPQYTFREYSSKNDWDCESKSLLILKDGKRYAFYSHILSGEPNYGLKGWSFDPKTEKLLIHNSLLEKSQWMEQVRVIDLITKQETSLPLDSCLTHGMLNSAGLIISQYMEPKEGAPTVHCLLKMDGTLIYKEHPIHVLGTSLDMFFMPQRYDVGLMLDINSQVLAENTVISRENPERHRIIALDFTKKGQWATFLFPPDRQPGGFTLDMGNYDPEYDLSSFTWAHPQIRFRAKIYDSGNCCTGSWKWGEWHHLIFEKIFN